MPEEFPITQAFDDATLVELFNASAKAASLAPAAFLEALGYWFVPYLRATGTSLAPLFVAKPSLCAWLLGPPG